MELYQSGPEEEGSNSKYIAEMLPSLWENLKKVEQLIKTDSFINPELDNYHNLMASWAMIRKCMEPLEDEIGNVFREEWELENRIDHGLVCSHTISAVVMASISDDFKSLDLHDQNIILWGCLLHDICKRGPPVLKSKDPLHPFTCAASALNIFCRFGWIPHPELVPEAVQYINSSFFTENDLEYMDNKRLPEIFKRLLYITGVVDTPIDTFSSYLEYTRDANKHKLYVFEIIAIILFHQSIDLELEFRNWTPLTPEEVLTFTSPRLIKLVTILEKGDHGSYNLSISHKTWTFSERIDIEYYKYLELFTNHS